MTSITTRFPLCKLAVMVLATVTMTGGISGASATISWGDGSSSAGTFVSEGSHVYDITGSHEYTATGTYTVEVTATRSTTTDTADNTMYVTTEPTITAPGNQTGTEAESIDLTIGSSQANDDALAFSAVSLPSGLSLDSSGDITGTIAAGDESAFAYHVTETVTDTLTGGTASMSFHWTVHYAPPTIASPGNQSDTEDQSVHVTVSSSQFDDDALTYSAVSLPSGVHVNSSGSIVGTISYGDAASSPYHVTETVTDTVSGDKATMSFNWTIGYAPPTIAAPGNQTNFEEDSVDVTVSASDHDADALAFSATDLPGGLGLDSSGDITGIIAAGAANGSVSDYHVTETVTDTVSGKTATTTFDWTVSIAPPTIASPGDQTNDEEDSVNVSMSLSQADDDTLSFSATGLPAGLSLDAAGDITGTISVGDAVFSPYQVTETVTDTHSSDSATASFNWTISDAPPDLTSPGDQTNTEGDVVDVLITATQAEGDGLAFSSTNLPPGLGLDGSGDITGTILDGYAANSPYQVTEAATDTVTNEIATVVFNWTVSYAPPTISSPGDQINFEEDIVYVPYTGSQPDYDVLDYSASSLPNGLGFDSSGDITGTIAFGDAAYSPYTVTETVTDTVSSATAVASFTWTVNPVPPPALSSPGDQNNFEGDTVFVASTGSQPDTDALMYSATSLPAGLGFDSSGDITGTIAADDAGGGVSVYNVVETVTDTLSTDTATTSFDWTVTVGQPTIGATDQTNTEEDTVNLPPAGWQIDGDSLTYSISGLPNGLGLDASGDITGTVAVGDSGGGVSVYYVAETVTDAASADTANTSFNWTVFAVAPPTL